MPHVKPVSKPRKIRRSLSPTFDREFAQNGLVAGIDEVGRGPWAGPVVAAAVILHPHATPPGIRDSKALSPQRREELFKAIHHCALIGVGMASVDEIDTLNIAGATRLSMTRAVEALTIPPSHCLVDGNMLPDLPCPAQAIVKGDAISVSIAAASIIAKVIRDRMMRALAEEFPHYAWEKNKGYGVKAHQEGLNGYGVTPHHRKSFAPIRDILSARGSL